MKKLSMPLLLTTLCALCLLPISALAHTGVSQTTGFIAGFVHPIGGADHLLAMMAVGLWAAQMGDRAAWAVPGTFVSMMIAGGVLGISGIQVSYVEEGILVSVLVLGALIAGMADSKSAALPLGDAPPGAGGAGPYRQSPSLATEPQHLRRPSLAGRTHRQRRGARA